MSVALGGPFPPQYMSSPAALEAAAVSGAANSSHSAFGRASSDSIGLSSHADST